MGTFTPEIITLIGLVLAVAGMLATQSWRYNTLTQQRLKDMSGEITKLDKRVEKLEDSVDTMGREVSHLDGLLEGLRDALTGNRAA